MGKGKTGVRGDRRAKGEGHLHLRTVTAGTLWCQKYAKGVGTRASASSPRCPGAASEPLQGRVCATGQVGLPSPLQDAACFQQVGAGGAGAQVT